jgi:hypothetical protein
MRSKLVIFYEGIMMLLKGSCHCKAITFEVKSHTPYPFMRCYCSICRKTAGGGGYAINIMGEAKTLRVKGKKQLQIYQAKISNDEGEDEISSAQRHFCKQCGSCLWIFDPSWPDLVHPFASAIDTPIPKAPHEVFIMLDFAAPWCKISKTKNNQYYSEYPAESIEEWHRRLKLYR